MTKLSPLLLILVLVAFQAEASENETKNEINDLHPVLQVAGAIAVVSLVEGFFYYNSTLAADDPVGYAGVMLLLAPLAWGSGTESDTAKWVSGIGFLSLMAYNLSVDTKKTNKKTIRDVNFIGINVAIALTGLTDYYTNDKKSKSSFKLNLNSSNSLGISYNYKF